MTRTQCDYLLAYLKQGGAITPLEALNRFGINRLASRCYDLRERGHKIGSYLVPVRTRQGKTVRVARYYLLANAEAVRPAEGGSEPAQG